MVNIKKTKYKNNILNQPNILFIIFDLNTNL